MTIHPLISLLSFIIFAAFVSLGQTVSSVIGFILLLVVWGLTCQLPAPKVWVMVKRLRVFFLSLFIMYLWFTPGQLLWPVLDTWSPTIEGITQGVQRVVALVLLVFGVETLLRLLNRAELLTGLYFLATPFQCVGIHRERFILRVLLTLEAVEPNTIKKNHEMTEKKWQIKQIQQYLAQISQRLADGFNAAEKHSDKIEDVVFEIMPLPHWVQWLIPLMVAALFGF